MAFTPKDWKNFPDTTTPITAEALEDLEERVTDYATPPIDWTNNTTSPALALTQATNASASISTGGAIRITNTLSTGIGLLVYSAQASPSGRLAVINAAHTGFNQSALRIEHFGSGRGLDINQSGTGIGANIVASGGNTPSAHGLAVSLANSGSTTSSAISASSSNASHSAVQVTGVESGRGTIKISHVKPTGVADTNASALSIDLAGIGTAAQGIFIDSSATTTGNLLNVRNGGEDRLVLGADGDLHNNGNKVLTREKVLFAKQGVLATTTGAVPYVFEEAGTIQRTIGRAGTAPAGADLIIDVNKNGSSIYSPLTRPRITAGQFAITSVTAPTVQSVSAGDYITVDIDQVGSSTPGSDLNVQIIYTVD